MNWLNVPVITFAVVAMNHLGLVAAIERTVKHRLPIISCPKCMTFWAVLADGILTGISRPGDAIVTVAVALLAAWAAIWLELFMGFIDRQYLRAYEQIYPAAAAADTDETGPRDTVSDVPADRNRYKRKRKRERKHQ